MFLQKSIDLQDKLIRLQQDKSEMLLKYPELKDTSDVAAHVVTEKVFRPKLNKLPTKKEPKTNEQKVEEYTKELNQKLEDELKLIQLMKQHSSPKDAFDILLQTIQSPKYKHRFGDYTPFYQLANSYLEEQLALLNDKLTILNMVIERGSVNRLHLFKMTAPFEVLQKAQMKLGKNISSGYFYLGQNKTKYREDFLRYNTEAAVQERLGQISKQIEDNEQEFKILILYYDKKMSVFRKVSRIYYLLPKKNKKNVNENKEQAIQMFKRQLEGNADDLKRLQEDIKLLNGVEDKETYQEAIFKDIATVFDFLKNELNMDVNYIDNLK